MYRRFGHESNQKGFGKYLYYGRQPYPKGAVTGISETRVTGGSITLPAFIAGDLIEIFTLSISKSTSVAPDLATNLINS